MKEQYIYVALVLIVVGGLVLVKLHSNPTTKQTTTTPESSIDIFAQCLTDAGIKFYGAFWCPHCQAQKKLFEQSKFLPYVECSTPDGKGQTQECIDRGIKTYPTWITKDGTWLDGEQNFDTLAEKTGCAIPNASVTP